MEINKKKKQEKLKDKIKKGVRSGKRDVKKMAYMSVRSINFISLTFWGKSFPSVVFSAE